jgi:RNA polymerase sigma-70 factor (ECF subfamily)
VTRFATTRWSVIVRAASDDDAEAQLALALLCEAYWYPVYAYVRRQGSSPADAEDLTQAYFARFLEKQVVREVQPPHGRFRAFLLVSVRNFLHNQRDRERSLKRGGGRRLLSLDAEIAEQRLRSLPADSETPETLFEKSWALTVFERVQEQLMKEAERRGSADRAAQLRPYLTGDEPAGGEAALAREWGVSEGAVRVALHRLRKRFASLLRAEVTRTVAGLEDVDDELRRLLAALR